MGMAFTGLFVNTTYSLSDDAVVDSIKAYSNLTQSDVDRWKFLWMGPWGGTIIEMAGLYGKFKISRAGLAMTPSQEKLKNIFESDLYIKMLGQWQPSQTVQNIITSKWTWAGISVIGASIAVDKLLRPRVHQGLLVKIDSFIALCERLAVTRQSYYDEQQLRQALNQPGNTVWLVSSPIAQKYGFENIIEQANVALLLIDQIYNVIPDSEGYKKYKAELDDSRMKIIMFKDNAAYNMQFIQNALWKEQQARAQKRSEYGQELEIQGKEAGVAGQRIKTLKNQWKLLKDIGETAKTYGPGILAGIGSLTVVAKFIDWWNAPVKK